MNENQFLMQKFIFLCCCSNTTNLTMIEAAGNETFTGKVMYKQ
jgi:hypothetical protein